MPPEKEEHENIKELVKENKELLEENRTMMKKLYRYTVVGLWLRILWYVVLIGLPFALYFYFLEPYFAAFGSSFETFKEGLHELPGVKSIDILISPEE